jgi:FkbM family methyltransferase
MIYRARFGGDKGAYADFRLELRDEDPGDNYLAEFLRGGWMYEAEVTWVFLRTVRPGDTVIDVGANVGYFTLLSSQMVGATGRVHAIEACPANFDMLTKNLIRNNVSNVSLHNKPVWKKEQEVTFHFSSDYSSSSALIDPGLYPTNVKSRETPRSTKMQSMTLDSLDAKQVKLVKIDTEGSEQDVLAGAENLLSLQHPPYVVAELNPFGLNQCGYNQRTLRQFMQRYGYSCFLLHANGRLPSLVPDESNITFNEKGTVSNCLFSTLYSVSKAWPKPLAYTDYEIQL